MTAEASELDYLEARVVALYDELERDLAGSPERVDLDGGALTAAAFQDECYEVGHALGRIERLHPDAGTAAHLLRTALSYLLNYALVVKDRTRRDEDFAALERRYADAWTAYQQSRGTV